MTLVTLSAPYGAGGSHVGPEVARRLGVPFVDRAVPTGVAERLAVPLAEAIDRDESIGSTLVRMTVWLGQVGQAFGAPGSPVAQIEDEDFRDATEAVLREHARGGGAVVLGRAGAIVLRDEPGALHVRLEGPPEARIRQAMAIEGIDRETAERHLAETDKARAAYVSHFYRCDARDPAHYHLVLDSTALSLETCAELIVAAARTREQGYSGAGTPSSSHV